MRCESHGKYSAGGDSAGFLVMNGSCDNLFAYNRVTHGGDGFFLSAARESLESPSARNVVAFNDFSYSPHNAIEATFSSDNVFYGNLCLGSNYGVWAGYSYRTTFAKNVIRDALSDGIAIEHGHENVVDGNEISGANAGIRLWKGVDDANPLRKAPSENYAIARNTISRCREAGLLASLTDRLEVRGNGFERNPVAVQAGGGTAGLVLRGNRFVLEGARPDNLARGGTPSASLAPEQAARALDGKYEGEENAWNPGTLKPGDYWQVDLGAPREMDAIVIFPFSGNPHDFPVKFRVLGSATGEFKGEEAVLVKEENRPHQRYDLYPFPKGAYRAIRIVSDVQQDWIRLEEVELFAWPNIRDEYSFGGAAVRTLTSAAVDARGNLFEPAGIGADRIAVKGEGGGEVLTGDAEETTVSLPPEPKAPELPPEPRPWKIPDGWPRGLDQIVMDEWGPKVPGGWE